MNQERTSCSRKSATAIASPATTAPRTVRALVPTSTAPSTAITAIATPDRVGAERERGRDERERRPDARPEARLETSETLAPAQQQPVAHRVNRYIRAGAVDPDEVEAARDHRGGRPAEAEPERLLVALEHAMLVVEAVEVVGDPDRVGRDRLRAPLLGRVGGDARELGEPLHELALLRRERPGGLGGDGGVARVAQDPGDAGVRVLDVVDRVLLRALGREVDVDLDRLVRARG